jgi:predicted nucleic-acid-binding Zn-ribbon protein
MQNVSKLCCVACGGEKLCFGYLGIGGVSNVFIPSGVFSVSGSKTRSYVCLNCGYVNQYIPESKLERLRGRFKEEVEES